MRKGATCSATSLIAALIAAHVGLIPSANAQSAEVPFSTFDELDVYAQRLTEENSFSGVVLVAKDGEPIFHKAYGLASKNFQVPNRLDTKFNIGSLNKLFTSVAVSQLAARGKLSYDDTLGKHLEGFSTEAAEKVTIRHLLQMKSGWGDYWTNDTYRESWFRLRTVDDYMDFLKKMPLGFEPGTRMEHSNTSFEILGAVIEKASGQDYYDYIRQHVYVPAGMTNTDSYDRDGPVGNLATNYTNMNPSDPVHEGYRWSNTYMLSPRGTPAGGGYSTTGDLLKFDLALRDHKLLDEKHTNLLFRRYEGGLEDEFRKPVRPLMYAGGAFGLNSLLGIDLDNGYTIVVMSNYDPPIAIEIGRSILQMLKDSPPETAEAS
jgi:CubicO group peptidase (beta-lactamase class C family)